MSIPKPLDIPIVVAVQSLIRVQLFMTPWTVARQASLFTISQSLLKHMSIDMVMPYSHLILCCPLFLLPSIFPSIRVFSSESALCIGWPKYWSFSFGISPSKEYSALICSGIDWFDLFAIQRTLKSLLQHHSVKTSVLQCSAFFMVQWSHLCMTTGRTIALSLSLFFLRFPSPLFLQKFFLSSISLNIYILVKYSWLSMFQVYSKVIQLHEYTYIIFEIIFHYKLSQDINYCLLCYTVNLCCLFHI